MYRTVLVTLDGSPLSESVLPHAEALGRAFEAELLLLQVITDAEAIPWGFHSADNRAYVENLRHKAIHAASEYLKEKAAALAGAGVEARVRVAKGNVVDTILRVADEEAVDLIAMATHGWSGLNRWVYGSVADRVLRGAVRPVMLIRSTEPD